MVDSQIRLTTSIVMIILFAVAIIGFAVGFANDNNSVVDISDDPELMDFNTNAKANMSNYKTDSENTYNSILDTTIEPGSDVAQSTGPFSITTRGLIRVSENIIYLPYRKIFGSGSGFGIFFTTFIALLLFIAGLLIYKTLRGNP